MAETRPTIAGRPVPPLTGIGIRLAVAFAFGAVGWQALHLEASLAASRSPAAATASSVQTPLAALVTPAASDPFANVRRLSVGRQLLHGEYVWNEAGAPAGRVTMLVDLSAQTLSVFRGGQEIGRAVILYGTDENPTPTGSFTILEKDVDHESTIYDARMPFMLRLTNDGIAIHGSNVRYGSASRGCIGVPEEFAQLLFAQARVGDEVRIVPGDPNAAGPPVSPQAIGSDA